MSTKRHRGRRTLDFLVGRIGYVPASEIDWYKQRLEMLQTEQKFMRDPERTLVCDILANGQLLPDPKGIRYGKPNSAIGEK